MSTSDLFDTSSKKNKSKIYCKNCKSLILLEQNAQYIESNYDMPTIENTNKCNSSEIVKEFWLVDDIMKFENVGFTNTVKNIKYLICADCEVGPLGFQNLDDKNKLYLALNRVAYN